MEDPDLTGKVAIVTGGGRGMGRVIALALARAGALGVTVTSAGSPDEIKTAVEEMNNATGRDCGLVVLADVGDPEACARAVEKTVNRFGALQILINNAGKGMRNVRAGQNPFWKNDTEAWLRLIDTNINGPFLMAQAACPHMVEAGWGRIINVSKSARSMIGARNSPYGPSKAALDAMTLINLSGCIGPAGTRYCAGTKTPIWTPSASINWSVICTSPKVVRNLPSVWRCNVSVESAFPSPTMMVR